jgi:hypothetical protein
MGLGLALCAVSGLCEQNRNLSLWQHTEWLLMFYWLGFAATLVLGVRHAALVLRARGKPKPDLVLVGLAVLAAAPIVYRAAWILWHFHGNTGRAEGMGWVPLTYPAALALSMVTVLAFLAHVAEERLPLEAFGLAMLALALQQIPHCALYFQGMPPFDLPTFEPLRNLGGQLVGVAWLGHVGTALQLVIQTMAALRSQD